MNFASSILYQAQKEKLQIIPSGVRIIPLWERPAVIGFFAILLYKQLWCGLIRFYPPATINNCYYCVGKRIEPTVSGKENALKIFHHKT